MQTKVYNKAKAEAFADQLVDTLNKSALSLMISLGHRSGLFDVMSKLPPATFSYIAHEARLNERYVKEWLGAMVTSGIVEMDSITLLYHLPPEHAAFLTHASKADNLAVFTQYISVLGSVEDDILQCFKKGGGVPYSKFNRFHEVMAEDSGQSVLSSLETDILPLVPGLIENLKKGIKVLDAGCGAGRILLKLAPMFPNSHFLGLDLSEEAVNDANAIARINNITNLEFKVIDLSNFDLTAPIIEYDFITTFDAIHDQAFPLKVLKGIYKALKNNGTYLMQDIKGSSHMHNNIEHPIGTFLYTISCMHCMTVSLAQGGEGLGAMWGKEKTHEYLHEAGFTSIKTYELEHDIQNNWYVIQK